MWNREEEFQKLKEQNGQKKNLEARFNCLEQQRKELEERERQLYLEKIREQKDVEELEKVTFKAVFSYLTGKREEKLDKEKKEAYDAVIKYNVVKSQLDAVMEDQGKIRAAMSELRSNEDRYQKLLEEKKQWIKVNYPEKGDEIFKMEEELEAAENQLKEVQEAILAGETVKNRIESVEKSLDSAHGWGTWDLFGGGMISDIAKHNHLKEAQDQIDQLQISLRRFRTELADVEETMDIRVEIDGFLHFADFFFDGLFADWAVMNKIDESRKAVYKAETQTAVVLDRLKRQKEELAVRIPQLKELIRMEIEQL